MRIWIPLLVLAMSAADAFAGAVATSRYDFPVTARATIVVDSDAGAIEVGPGPAGAVHVEALRQADSDAAAQQLAVDARLDGNVVRIKFVAAHHGANEQVDFHITAPADTQLQLRTGGGSVRARGFDAGVDVKSGGGSLEVTDVRGVVRLRTGGGSVEARHVVGSVEIGTGGGSIHVEGALRGQCRAETGGGSIHVAIPADSRLTVDAATGGGSAHNDFGLPTEGRINRRFSGRIGDGGNGSLVLRTGGGSITLTRS
jgi:hypothetical protein